MIQLTKESLLNLIPNYVVEISEKLQSKGFEAFLVGGSVRDIMLGKRPDDYDIATNALPEDVENVFDKSIPVGAQFGTIIVVTEDEKGERFDVEVTTYRSEADYVGGRWPAKVDYAKTINEDLKRRDFTINAIALNLQEFDNSEMSLKQMIIDPFGGKEDLKSRIIKAVGDPLERFTEDGLRAVRACRLVANLDSALNSDDNDLFKIEDNTFSAINKTLHITKRVSVERFRDELMKLLLKSPKPSKGLRLMRDCGILELFIPELLEGEHVHQPQFHVDDVFEHSLKTCDLAEDRIKVAALLHDIGKPRCYSKDDKGVHFYGHDVEGEKMSKEIMKRLKFPNIEIERASKLIRWHMFYYPSSDWRKSVPGDEYRVMSEELEQRINQQIPENSQPSSRNSKLHGWSDSAIRRLIINVGGEDAIDDLMRLRIADATANPKSEWDPVELDALSERISEVRSKDMALKITDLDITGKDLMENFEIETGPQIGEILNFLLDKIIEEPIYNKKEDLLKFAKEYLEEEK
ncbi:MAG: HD domain-containing protein [Candidatus Dojkabacteria bacterium]|nr:HD domain-containing protein [Candidatus Dojkabacteria bacterium]MDQ7021785.1 HD domain-containing protein [Candidatus Dojkabacteria bacterium]